MNKKNGKIFTVIAIIVLVIGAVFGGAISDRIFGYKILDKIWPSLGNGNGGAGPVIQRVVTEESAVINSAEKVAPSVVTIGISTTQAIMHPSFNFNDPFGFFGGQQNPGNQFQQQQVNQDIGSGFILTKDGLIVTNKHVVSDSSAGYRVITYDNKEYKVQKIFRDPTNDIAILKINPDQPTSGSAEKLTPVVLGDSGNLKVGQFVIAIGTALGEFRHTVTHGVISGLGRGISAGSPYESSVEQLDNVIQTDAAINPGNSGGPLVNLSGQVIGINTAVSSQGQNIGFAIPINIVKTEIDNFNNTGQFSRPYIGVRYVLLDMNRALEYDVPTGAYVQEVISGSPADKAGIQNGDIITKIDGKKITGTDATSLSNLISPHKVGDTVQVEYWRSGNTKTVAVTLSEASQ